MKKVSLALATLYAIPSVMAARSMGMADFNIGEVFEMIFGRNGLGGVLSSEYGVYGLTLIFYYLLFFSVYSAALKRVKVFEGEGGLGLSTPGKILANSFAGLSVLAIFAFVNPNQSNLFSILAIFGIYGQLLLVIVAFTIVYRWVKRGD